jgi:hypothetical protein
LSREQIKDIADMHNYYGFGNKVRTLSSEDLYKLFLFRIAFLDEEMRELKEAQTPEDVVDALVDLIVVAIGTLDIFDIDALRAWNEVHVANMTKEVGIKASRPNPLKLPDLIKPAGWVAPDHTGNIGLLQKIAELEGKEISGEL